MKKILLLTLFLATACRFAFAQESSISGRITDETGASMPGVNITVKGTAKRSLTDRDGKFVLSASPDAIIQIAFIGYQTKEIPVGNQSVINHQMVSVVTQLSEVVVTGYTTEEKKDIVGSVAVIKTADLMATPSGNVTARLQGRSAGVTVQTDGTPGGSAKVRIRGFGSFGGSDPLYVIDGVPATSGGNTASPVDNLNPDDIESLQVLKDAAAASVYGARAANGVVVITTKRGKSGSAKFTYDGYSGSNYVNKNNIPDLLNTQEYADLIWKQLEGAHTTLGPTDTKYIVGGAGWTHPQFGTGATPIIPEYIFVSGTGVNKNTSLGGTALEALKKSDPAAFAAAVDPANYDFTTHQIIKAGNSNWFSEVYRPALQQSHQIGASGGSDQGNYSMSLNYFNQDNTYSKYHFFDRYTLRANTSFKIRENIRLGENLQVSYTSRNLNDESVQTVWAMSPLIPVYDIMGNPASSQAPGVSGTNAQSRNPVTEPFRNRFDRIDDFGVFGNMYAEVDILKGLTARTSFGVDKADRRTKDFTPKTTEHAENTAINSLSQQANSAVTWTWTNQMSFSQTFNKVHSLKLLLGTEAIKTKEDRLTGGNTSYDLTRVDDPNFLILNAGTGTQTTVGEFSRNTLFSLFSRVDYSYAGKYLFNATLRRDQSSKFAKDTRTGYFPAVALGWRVSSEEFMNGINWLNDLKLRGSWGKIGNQNGLNFLNQYNVYSADLAQSYSVSGGNAVASTLAQSRYGNSQARWEENITTNIGLDATIFNNSWDITAEWYVKKTNGLLVTNQAPWTGATGASAPTQFAINAGDMKNTGIDLGITKRGGASGGLQYEVGVTFSRYKNEVTKVLDNPLSTLVGGGTGNAGLGSVTLTSVGNPISMFYGYEQEGFFNTQAEVDAYKADGYLNTLLPPSVGRWRIKDLNGDKIVNALDRKFLGSPHPKFQIGFNLSAKYKNFDATGFLFWNQGNKIFNLARSIVDFNTYSTNRSRKMLTQSWTPELGNDAKLPKLDISDTFSSTVPTNYYVQDASYLRLKTLQLGYTFPAVIARRLKVDKLRIYAQAQNLFTLNKKEYDGLDPDASLTGADLSMGVVNNTSPTPRQFLIGLSLGF